MRPVPQHEGGGYRPKKTAPLGAVKSREETPKEGITAASDCKMTILLQRTNVNGFGTGFKQIFLVLKFYPFLMEGWQI